MLLPQGRTGIADVGFIPLALEFVEPGDKQEEVLRGPRPFSCGFKKISSRMGPAINPT